MRQHLASGHSAARCLAGIFLALICLLPASCTDSRDTITVGSKNFGESNVLAQMFAILIRERGIPVAGPIAYPSTQSVLAAYFAAAKPCSEVDRKGTHMNSSTQYPP